MGRELKQNKPGITERSANLNMNNRKLVNKNPNETINY